MGGGGGGGGVLSYLLLYANASLSLGTATRQPPLVGLTAEVAI